MYNKVIDFLTVNTAKIPDNVMFFIALSLVGISLVWEVLQVSSRKKMYRYCRGKMSFHVFFGWAFVLLAFTKYGKLELLSLLSLALIYFFHYVFSLFLPCKYKLCNSAAYDLKQQTPSKRQLPLPPKQKQTAEVSKDKSIAEKENVAIESLENEVETKKDKLARIKELADEIERKRQRNIDITDGKKENKFSGVDIDFEKDQPSVVLRKVVENVSPPAPVPPPQTGFTVKRITSHTEQLKTASNEAFRQISNLDQEQNKRSAREVLDALKQLKQSMTDTNGES
ncbi:MAG: hypothetical protein LBH47_03295 [Christensenellaceae bacterium]|jgi:hypothetical protein|nr:hypothetical protein [Christensenellaceae bacterium]